MVDNENEEGAGECRVPDTIRHQISVLARQKKRRRSQFTRQEPTKWKPQTVRDSNGEFFTDPGAWEFIAELVDSGHPLKEIELRLPPGKTAYVMKKRLDSSHPEIYIKVRLGAGVIIGRSFHYSSYELQED